MLQSLVRSNSAVTPAPLDIVSTKFAALIADLVRCWWGARPSCSAVVSLLFPCFHHFVACDHQGGRITVHCDQQSLINLSEKPTSVSALVPRLYALRTYFPTAPRINVLTAQRATEFLRLKLEWN